MHIELNINTESSSDIRNAFTVIQALHATLTSSTKADTAKAATGTFAGGRVETTAQEDAIIAAPLAKAPVTPPAAPKTFDEAVIGSITPAAVSEGEAFAAMQAAVTRGVQLPEIVALLAERKVAKVNQLSADDRATFVVAVSKLGAKS